MLNQDPNPLDLGQLKGIVERESARMKLRSYNTQGESTFTLALALSAGMKKIFFEKTETVFSSEPRVETKPIVQFLHRMRVDAMEKFNTTTVFSAIQLAHDQQELQREDYLLTLVVYLEQKFLPEFLRMMQYPYIDSDDEVEIKDGCGTIVNLIGGQFKREMAILGYRDLMMSPFQSYINTAPDGVAIPRGLTEKYEISFGIEGTKRLVLEMVTLSMRRK